MSTMNESTRDGQVHLTETDDWLKSLDDIMCDDSIKYEWLVDGILPKEGLVIISAHPKVGKSLLTLNLAFSVANGTKFLDRNVKQGRVFILQLEDPEPLIKDRGVQMTGTDISASDILVGAKPFEITDFDKEQDLRDRIERYDPSLIIIDPLTFAHDVDDEDKSAKMGRVMNLFRRIALDYGICLVLVHHNRKSGGKDGMALRGSSAILSSCDIAMVLNRGREAGDVTAEFTSRMGHIDALKMKLDADTLWFDSLGSIVEAEKKSDSERAAKLLEHNPGTKRQQLKKELGWGEKRLKKALNALESNGVLSTDLPKGTGKGRPPKLYSMQEASA